MKKFLGWTVAILIVGLGLFVGIRYYYVFGEGVKAGTLNFVVKKGLLFKTYEGRMIQSGIKSNAPNAVQSNQFDFSIIDEAVAQKLMLLGGHTVDLHYKEYFGSVPWRGYSQYIVDSVVAVDAAR